MDKLRMDEKCLTGFRKVSNASYLVEKMDVFSGVGFPGVYRRGDQRPDAGHLAVWRAPRTHGRLITSRESSDRGDCLLRLF